MNWDKGRCMMMMLIKLKIMNRSLTTQTNEVRSVLTLILIKELTQIDEILETITNLRERGVRAKLRTKAGVVINEDVYLG